MGTEGTRNPGELLPVSTYTHLLAPIVMTMRVAPSVTGYQVDLTRINMALTVEPLTMGFAPFQPLWDFSFAQMTFDDPRWTFDGLFAVPPVTPPVTPPVGPTPPGTPNLRVTAVSAGTYQGLYYVPGDVFDLVNILDYSDSTKNAQPNGAEWAPGWMLSVPPATPLYQQLAQQLYPTEPAVDPARRFVL